MLSPTILRNSYELNCLINILMNESEKKQQVELNWIDTLFMATYWANSYKLSMEQYGKWRKC